MQYYDYTLMRGNDLATSDEEEEEEEERPGGYLDEY